MVNAFLGDNQSCPAHLSVLLIDEILRGSKRLTSANRKLLRRSSFYSAEAIARCFFVLHSFHKLALCLKRYNDVTIQGCNDFNVYEACRLFLRFILNIDDSHMVKVRDAVDMGKKKARLLRHCLNFSSATHKT
ncbi:hypothetical protein PoB_004807800 [Plakobranchus ocellatus]|uniref:Uncharacterized protein n=1 Tax=Plakobranchus ocellatus TaxID=259542 RepID=A0AAV4BR14_9GAST|nr:hypothetical protein PoB_004807800 [Plakobranchus ocellatus]